MSRYILVSLWAADDPATTLSHEFACQLRDRRSPAAFIDGEAPPHTDVRSAADASPDAAVVLFAHGGSHLSARQAGAPWILAEGLADLLGGRRVYAFACSTFAPQARLLFNTFAAQAVAACVEVFAGHRAPIMTPLADHQASGERTREALFSLIERFIDGEQDQQALQNLGRRYASWDLPIELDLPSEDPRQEGAFGWSSAAFLGGFFQSLSVRTKAHDAQSEEGGEPAAPA